MLAEQRYAEIMRILRTKEVVKGSELMEAFSISTETMRKDLKHLEERGCLRRVHGGAVLSDGRHPPETEPAAYVSFEKRVRQSAREKGQIALAAAELVREGQNIGLDSGTTSHELAKVLRERFHSLTVVTNSFLTANVLVDRPGFKVITTGGVFTADEGSLVSSLATLVLDHIRLDQMFLTATGISPEVGVTDQRQEEVLVHQKMMECAGRVVVLADHTKFGAASLFRVCPLERVDILVTDSGAPPQMAERLRQGVGRLIVAPDGEPPQSQ